jgi:hypothetical protein
LHLDFQKRKIVSLNPKALNEAFLHYLWQLQYFKKDNLQTLSGETLHVFHPGIRNPDSGPDFSNARIKIGELEWRGSVEIHIKASGWMDHQHSSDEAYEKVVLHVVWENDKVIKRTDGSLMPTFELKNRVDASLLERYKNLYTSVESIPCVASWAFVPALTKFSMLDNALLKRLDNKASAVHELFTRNGSDWDQTCYQLLFKNFGFKVNSESMFRLAQILSQKTLLKHFDKQIHVEALLFGMGGFLENVKTDDYSLLLTREYDLLRRKYSLDGKQMNLAQWKFLRLRPANFPTVRLAQLSALLSREKSLFSAMLEVTSYRQLHELLSVNQSEYWQEHYQFGKTSKSNIPALGESSIQNIVINTVVPLLTAYGKIHDEQSYIDLAIELLQHIPAENNKIIRQWINLGYPVKTAFDSQALIEQNNNYCMKRRCLECNVGSYLIKV